MNLMWPQPSPPPIPMATGLLHAPRGQVWFVLYIRLTRKGSHTDQSCLSSVAYILKHHFPLLPLASSATPLPTNLFLIIPPSQIYFALLPSKFNLTSPLSHPLLFLNALGSSPSPRLCFCFPTTGGLSFLLFTSSPCFKIHLDNSLSYI